MSARLRSRWKAWRQRSRQHAIEGALYRTGGAVPAADDTRAAAAAAPERRSLRERRQIRRGVEWGPLAAKLLALGLLIALLYGIWWIITGGPDPTRS